MLTQKLLSYALESSELGYSKLSEEVTLLGGFTSNKNRHLLNNICAFGHSKYLEIGTHHGATLVSASYKNIGDFIGIDNFSELDGSEKCFNCKTERFKEYCNFSLIVGDNFDENLISRIQDNYIDIYFYDGNHSEEAHYNALFKYINKMKKNFCYIVDDWNWTHVSNGTDKAINDIGLRIIYHCDLFTPDKENGRADSWWNGLGIFLLEKP